MYIRILLKFSSELYVAGQQLFRNRKNHQSAREHANYRVIEELINKYFANRQVCVRNSRNAAYNDLYVDGLADFFAKKVNRTVVEAFWSTQKSLRVIFNHFWLKIRHFCTSCPASAPNISPP